MGSFSSKSDLFATVLADQHVKIEDEIVLQCKANTEDLTATWQRNGQKLYCVDGKHTVEQVHNLFRLKIKNAKVNDEGKYTITLQNRWKSDSCSALVTVDVNEWRGVQWNQKELMNTLRHFKIHIEEVKQLNFLLYGPVGAGKSSVINTIKTIFEGRQYVSYLAAQETAKSQTLYYKKCEVGNTEDGFLPFTFIDIMGVEEDKEHGVHTDDIISALKGHVKDGYLFNSTIPLTAPNSYYLEQPTLSDKIHCLVYVIPADKISIIHGDTIQKMKKIRETANRMDLPQVILMTRVDMACSLTQENLRGVYKSMKIKKKMDECSVTLGVPMNCIFPVRNYHKETDIIEDVNCLMLHILTTIVPWADDYVVNYTRKQSSAEQSK